MALIIILPLGEGGEGGEGAFFCFNSHGETAVRGDNKGQDEREAR